ncbi:MAG: hypothetical protein ACR2OZ_13840 [Verrucomicrobiales bacterium]
MKKLIALVSLVAFQATPVMAHVGGPWSSNTPDNNLSGIFGGMITMRNGSGMFRFSQGETAQLSTFSSSMIFYQGTTYMGSCQANIDWPTKKIFGITNGSAFNRSPFTNRGDTPPLNDNNPNFIAGANQPRTFGIPLTSSIAGDRSVTLSTFQFTNVGVSGPVGIANTHWQGKITKSSPTVRFEAKGLASFTGANPIIFRITAIEGPSPPGADGLPINSNEAIIPGPLEELSIDFGGNDPIVAPRNRQKIRVFGSRITYNANPSAGGTNGGIGGTGGGAFAF